MSSTRSTGVIAQLRGILGNPPLTSLFESHIGDWYHQVMDHDASDLAWLTEHLPGLESAAGIDVMCGGGRLARTLSLSLGL